MPTNLSYINVQIKEPFNDRLLQSLKGLFLQVFHLSFNYKKAESKSCLAKYILSTYYNFYFCFEASNKHHSKHPLSQVYLVILTPP